jgi:hypothetical protein
VVGLVEVNTTLIVELIAAASTAPAPPTDTVNEGTPLLVIPLLALSKVNELLLEVTAKEPVLAVSSTSSPVFKVTVLVGLDIVIVELPPEAAILGVPKVTLNVQFP